MEEHVRWKRKVEMSLPLLIWVLLTLLTGRSWGLEVGMEYDYRYYGEVWVGIPEIRKQVSGVAIRTDVSFQVKDVDHVLAKFQNFEVGDMNGDLPCDRDARLPIENWEPLPNPYAKMIQDPFKFNMMEVPRGEFVMEVSPDEPHWLTDIRKSVATIFRIYPLTQNIHHRKSGLELGDFNVKEETFFGKCTGWYQVTPVRDAMKLQEDARLLSDMEEDSQLGRAGFADKLWKISRKVDFAACEEFVKVRDLAMQNECGERPYQCNRGDLGRSHTCNYNLRGDENDMRMEYAEIEDWAIMEPYAMGEKGYQTEQIRAMTKQKLNLYAARPIRFRMVHETGLNITSWRYDLQPPPHHAGRQPSFDELMVGVDIDPTMVPNIMDDMMKGICSISKKLNGVAPDDFINEFDAINHNMNYLEEEQIEIINDKLKVDQSWDGLQCWKTWIKIITVSGAKPTQEFLLRQLRGNKLPRELIINCFANVAANAQSTYIFKDLIQYVADREGDGDDDLTMLCVYQLTYFSNWCVQPVVKAGLTDPTCGHQHCDPSLVNEIFLPFLDRGIRNLTLPHWQRVIYMVMLCGIRSTFKNDVLRPFITGETPSSNGVRLNAIASLSLYKMPPETREECMDMLSAVLDDYSESSSIRACSYMIILTWRPTPAWWHMKAIDTWKEPNRQIASLSFKSTIVKYTSDRRLKWLDLIIPIMKPAPSSGASMSTIQHNYYKILTTGYESTWMNTFIVARNDETYPERYVQFYQPMRVGTWFPQTQVLRYVTMDLFKTQDVWYGMRQYFWGTYPTKKIQEDPVADIIRSLYNQHKEYIGVKSEESWIYGSWYLYTKWQRSYESAIPVTMRPEDFINFNYLIKTLPANHDFQEGLFFNYGKINIGFPSSLGIPIVFKSSSPNYVSATGNWKLKSAKNFPTGIKARGEFDSTFRSTWQTHITARAITPWNNRALIAGMEQTICLLFPFKYELEVDTTISNDLTIRMTQRPKADNAKINLISSYNVPFTVRAPLYPYTNYMKSDDWKLLEVRQPEKKIESLSLPTLFGIEITSLAVDYPGPYYNLFPYPHTSKTLKFWSWEMWYDPKLSTTKAVTVSLSYERPNESMESKSWGQPIDPVTRLVDFGRQRLVYKRPDLFTVDPNVQRRNGKFSLEGTSADMIRPSLSDRWKPDTTNREPLKTTSGKLTSNEPRYKEPLSTSSTSFNDPGPASGKLTDKQSRNEKIVMPKSPVLSGWGKAPSQTFLGANARIPSLDVNLPNVYTNMSGPFKSFQGVNNIYGRLGWTSSDTETSYEKYTPMETLNAAEEFAMFASHMRHYPSEGDHERHQMIWSVNHKSYLDDVEILEFPKKKRKKPKRFQGFTGYTITNKTNKSRYPSEENNNSNLLLDYDEFDYSESMDSPKLSRKKRQSNIPFHTFPFTDTSAITALNVDIELESNTKKRVEMDFYWAQGGAEGRFGSHIQTEIKLMIGYGTPFMMCMNLEGTWPYLSAIHLVRDFVEASKAGNNHKFLLWIWSGEQCIIDQPTLEMVGQFSLSKDGVDYINNCIVKFVGEKNCPYRMDDPAYYLLHRFYDDAIIKATWFDRTPRPLVNVTHFFADFLTGLTGPLIWKNRMVRNEPNKALLKAKRRVVPELLEWYYHFDRNSWDVEVSLPNSNAFLQDLRIHKLLEDIIMPYPFLDFNNAEWIRGADAAICRIEHNKISTTDHTVIWAGPTNCWSVASKDCTTAEEWMVLVRNDQGNLIARLIWPEWAVMIEITRDAAWINGDPVQVKDQIIGHGWKIIRQNADMFVFFKDGQHIIRVGEFVWFMPGYLVTNRICGLCGNMNDLYYDETLGPKGCAYGDHDLLVLAWTVASCELQNCNTWELMKAKAPIYTIQKNRCRGFPHIYVAARYGKNSKAISSCTTWFYEKRKLGEYTCIAEKPSPTCKPGCVSPSTRPVNSTQCASGDTPLEELTAGPLVGPWQFKSSGLRAANPECSEVPLEYKCIRDSDLDPDQEHFGECKTSLYYTIIPTYVPAMCFPKDTPVFPYPGM